MASASKRSKVSIPEEDLICPVCLTIPRSIPVRACKQGHIVCNKCYGKLRVTDDNLKLCPTCRKEIADDTFSIVGSLIQSMEHPCKFMDNGCQTKKKLSQIYQHEVDCLFREIECPECEKKVLVSKLGSHDSDCWSKKERGKAIEDSYVVNYDWGRSVNLLLWDNKEFYTLVGRVEPGRWFFSVTMVGNVMERSKYKAKVYLENPNSDWEMDWVTVSEILPIEALSDDTVVLESVGFGSVMDKIMERYIYNNKEGVRIFTVKIEMDKW